MPGAHPAQPRSKLEQPNATAMLLSKSCTTGCLRMTGHLQVAAHRRNNCKVVETTSITGFPTSLPPASLRPA